MKSKDLGGIDRYISTARVALSLLALLSIYIDPVVAGPFTMEPLQLSVLGLHLAYSLAAMVFAAGGGRSTRLARTCEVLDVSFATAVAFVTEGFTSPSHVFFSFAIVAVGCRDGLRATLRVTVTSVLLYSASICLLGEGGHLYVMRPAYLGLIGCLVGFLGQERVRFEGRIRELEVAAQRHSIARSLHDGYVQALAGMNLRLGTCRELLSSAKPRVALAELDELQAGIAREYDEVRSYLRQLADAPPPQHPRTSTSPQTLFHIHVDITANGDLGEQVLQIALEAMRNCRRHGRARSAVVRATLAPDVIRISIEDDGVGFGPQATPPWSIASRVAESGGRLRIPRSATAGARLDIELPMS